jgi:teichuronic acid biosynthesis glycosyltransferase TuaC
VRERSRALKRVGNYRASENVERFNESDRGNTPAVIRVLVLTRMWPTPDRPGTFVKDEVDALRRLGIDCQVIAELGSGGLWCYVRLWRRMWRSLKEERFDVVHAHYGTTGWMGRLQWRVPLVVTFHGSDLMGGRLTRSGNESVMGFIEMALSWLLARLVPDIIVVSPAMLTRTPIGRAYVIPAGVDLTEFRPLDRGDVRRLLEIRDDHPVALFVADPALANKRFRLANEAVQIAKRSIPDLELVAITRRSHAELRLWLNAADVLLLTSKREGSPMVVKEALACNLPVVSVDVGDVARRLQGVSGCRLVEDAPDAIAVGLIEVINGSERCNGREFVTNLDSDASARKIIAVYRRAVRRASPR